MKHGWRIDNNYLDYNYFEDEIALDMVQKYFYFYTGKSSTENCNCVSSNSECWAICPCSDSFLNVKEETTKDDEHFSLENDLVDQNDLLIIFDALTYWKLSSWI